MKLTTTCEMEIWSGFFGIDEDGNQPECGFQITIEVEDECLDREGEEIFPGYAVTCPKCGHTIEGPYGWEVVV